LKTATITDVIKGRDYRLRYRVKNSIGWGDYSSETTVKAASVPAAHTKPSFVSFDDGSDTMTLQLYKSDDNGGSAITLYELYVDGGDDFSSAFTIVSGYDGTSSAYDISAADGITLGETYRFKTRAYNSKGYSDYSDESYIAFGDIPATPAAPTLKTSSKTSITVEWTEPATGDLSITGYILNMDDGRNSDIESIYIGTNRPDITEYTTGDLTAGLPYRFTLNAINDNGYSEESTIVSFYTCEAPSSFSAPTYSASDEDTLTITLQWAVPAEDGGCAVTGYELYRNDADDTDPSVQIVGLTADDPSILEYQVDLSATGTVGEIY
jgi:hypothetical protein